MRIVLLALILLALGAPAASACRCAAPGDPAEELEDAAAAFYGKVVAVDAFSIYGVSYRFRVLRDYKDNLGPKVRVLSPGETTACGLKLQTGDRLGLLLDRDNGSWNGYQCGVRSRSRLARGARRLNTAPSSGRTSRRTPCARSSSTR